MATWKKVYTTGDDILVADGGTGASSFTDGAVVSGDTSSGGGGLTTLGLPSGQLMVGTGAVPTAGVVGGVLTSSGTTTLSFAYVADSVDATALKDGGVLWEQHMKDDSSYSNYLPTFNDSGTATLLAPSASTGHVLTFNGTSNVWAAPTGDATTIAIGDASSLSSNLPIILESSANAMGEDGTTFHYNPNTELLTVPNATITGTLTATASAASTVTLQDGSTQTSVSPILFSNGTANSGTGVGVMADVSDFNYNASSATLTVKNLTVDGTTTTLNVGTVEVDDANITIAKNAGVQEDAAAASLYPAVRVYITDDAGEALGESLYPQLQYSGSASTTTPTGWKLTKNISSTVSTTTGVASMDYENITGDANMSTVSSTEASIGIGAFKLCGSELWIQTA